MLRYLFLPLCGEYRWIYYATFVRHCSAVLVNTEDLKKATIDRHGYALSVAALINNY